MSWVVFLPLLVPFTTALLLLMQRDNTRWQKGCSLVQSLIMLVVSFCLVREVQDQGVVLAQMGNWRPPFGIVLAVDLLGAIMVGISAVVGFTTLLFSFQVIDEARMKGAYYSLFHFLLFGVNGAFMTGDLFNLFVFFEVILMSSYVLLVLGNEDKQTKAGLTYLSLNLIGSTLFLTGAGILYGQLGTLNMADIAQRIDGVTDKGLITMVAVLFFCVFGLKSAMFPLNTWLPGSYVTPPTPISALFAGLLTKVGVYSLYRSFTTLFAHDVTFLHETLLLPLAGLTMLLGVWGAVVQTDVRSILAFHSISQVGYILMGLALFSPLALAGGIFHMIHHSLIKSSLFLIGGGMDQAAGSQNLKKISGLLKKGTPLALLFMVSAMALSGIPPLSGFFSKYALVVSGLMENHPILVFAALVTSLFTLYSMVKIWRLGFWGELNVVSAQRSEPQKSVLWACGVSVVFVVLLTILAGPLLNLCVKAGEQILNRDRYINAVLSSPTVPYPNRGEGI